MSAHAYRSSQLTWAGRGSAPRWGWGSRCAGIERAEAARQERRGLTDAAGCEGAAPPAASPRGEGGAPSRSGGMAGAPPGGGQPPLPAPLRSPRGRGGPDSRRGPLGRAGRRNRPVAQSVVSYASTGVHTGTRMPPLLSASSELRAWLGSGLGLG